MCLFHLSFVSIFFPLVKTLLDYPFKHFLNLILVLTFLSTTFPCIAMRVQGNNADNVLGLFSVQSFVAFSFHLTYYQSESWQEAAFMLMAQRKSHLVKDDLQRCG